MCLVLGTYPEAAGHRFGFADIFAASLHREQARRTTGRRSVATRSMVVTLMQLVTGLAFISLGSNFYLRTGRPSRIESLWETVMELAPDGCWSDQHSVPGEVEAWPPAWEPP